MNVPFGRHQLVVAGYQAQINLLHERCAEHRRAIQDRDGTLQAQLAESKKLAASLQQYHNENVMVDKALDGLPLPDAVESARALKIKQLWNKAADAAKFRANLEKALDGEMGIISFDELIRWAQQQRGQLDTMATENAKLRAFAKKKSGGTAFLRTLDPKPSDS